MNLRDTSIQSTATSKPVCTACLVKLRHTAPHVEDWSQLQMTSHSLDSSELLCACGLGGVAGCSWERAFLSFSIPERMQPSLLSQPHSSLLVWNTAEGIAMTLPEINTKAIAVYVHAGSRKMPRQYLCLLMGRKDLCSGWQLQ